MAGQFEILMPLDTRILVSSTYVTKYWENLVKPKINNDYYHDLGDRWYQAYDDPVAVLRQESKTKNPWIFGKIKQHNDSGVKILDVGCGGGFFCNDLEREDFQITGLDISTQSLIIAKKYDRASKVNYIQGNAYELPFNEHSFDVVTNLDFLEHVEHPQKIISECARVLKPNGLFFYQTLNRNIASYLLVIKVMEFLVPNTPKRLHVSHLFIKPKELLKMLECSSLENIEMVGMLPKILSKAFLKGVITRKVPKDFYFKICKSLTISYLGYARK